MQARTAVPQPTIAPATMSAETPALASSTAQPAANPSVPSDLDPAIQWLTAHPELRGTEDAPLGGRYSSRVVLTDSGADLCVVHVAESEASDENAPEQEPEIYCWHDAREMRWAKPVNFREAHGSATAVFRLRPVNGAPEDWAFRMPSLGLVRIANPRIPASLPPPRPLWFPLREQNIRSPAVPQRGFQPVAATNPPSVGALAAFDVQMVWSQTPDVQALDINSNSSRILCVRSTSRWRCTAPSVVDPDQLFQYPFESIARLTRSEDRPMVFAVQESTWENGGNGEGSGAGGSATLVLFKENASSILEPTFMTSVGEMRWTLWRNHANGTPDYGEGSGDDSRYERETTRWFSEHIVEGDGCLRILAPRAEHVWADVSFFRIRSAIHPRICVLTDAHDERDVLLSEAAYANAPPDARAEDGPPVADDEEACESSERHEPPVDSENPPLRVRDHSGVWRLREDGSLLRISRDVRAQCRAAATP